jgi:hypothetical protein
MDQNCILWKFFVVPRGATAILGHNKAPQPQEIVISFFSLPLIVVVGWRAILLIRNVISGEVPLGRPWGRNGTASAYHLCVCREGLAQHFYTHGLRWSYSSTQWAMLHWLVGKGNLQGRKVVPSSFLLHGCYGNIATHVCLLSCLFIR